MEQQFEFLLPDHLVTHRFPIGTEEVIANAPRERFVDFYTRYYVPRQITFVASGDMNADEMEGHIREAFGQAPEKVFERVGFSGDHSRTIALVQSGAFQVGAVNFKVWEKESALGKVDPAKVTVIWQTPTYPDYQWSIRGDVDARFGTGFKAKVRETLLSIKDPALLAAFPRQSFVPARNADYQPILDTAKSIGLID